MKSTVEINMSIDDSLVLSNGVNDFLNEVFVDHQIEQQVHLNTTIEQFELNKLAQIGVHKLSEQNELEIQLQNRPGAEVDVEKDAVPVERAVNDENKEKTEQNAIAQPDSNQPNIAQEQIKSEERNQPQSIQQIIEQANALTKLKQNVEHQRKDQSLLNESSKSTTEIEMNADESLRLNDSQTIHQFKVNTSTKSNEVDMSVDESLVLNDIRNIFETSTSSASEFIITKPLKKIETPAKRPKKDAEMDTSCSDANDSLVLKEIKIVNNPKDCLDESPYLKSLPPPKQVFKLSRKRLNCETDSPNKKPHLSNNLFKSQLNATPLISSSKKWRSATYNPMTSSPKKMELGSPLKPIDCNIIGGNINNTLDNLLISNLNMMIQKSDQLPNLMGDYSNTYALPLINGRHKDLKTISPETLVNLMDGKYSESISCFTVVDSRYPYEYEGGHIDGSKNIYHKEEMNRYFFGTEKPTLITDKKLINSTIEKNIKQSSSNSMQRQSHLNGKNSKRLSMIKESENDENKLLNESTSSSSTTNEANKSNDKVQLKRHAIIFHCEFSSERGPTMCRHLRKIDRELNENCYPHLHYPEIYLLHGGYKLFFERFKNHCYPETYLPMDSSAHKQDLMKFKKKSKTWNCDHKFRSTFSTN